jgi:hypothetical protein|uniref:Uncharacterized protein n=1 Tax=viral metagenome TaxID=1070528 RepID=A0A6C0CJN6_9ZZZZ
MSKKSELSPKEKQEIWRQKQIYIFYGSGRPIFNINEKNMHIKSVYDNSYYFQKYIHTSIQINDLLKEI